MTLESPYRGNVEKNRLYAQLCGRESFLHYGEVPFPSHLLFTQFLDDTNLSERNLGIRGGFLWGSYCTKVVFYVDLGFSDGMQEGLAEAKRTNKEILYRNLYPHWLSLLNELYPTTKTSG